MDIIKKILETDIFNKQPPVLVDIGASDEINPKWKRIAAYSTCIAFDADDRDFHVSEQSNGIYKKLISFNRIVVSEPVEAANFYLTSWPYSSSLLKPDIEKLQPWAFSRFFEVEKSTQLPAITISEALRKVDINYIDWFKTDTQGTDLRLFKTLPQQLSSDVLAAEFEPGIIDAYIGEDKLFDVMKEMHGRNFWLSSMIVKGVQRLTAKYAQQLGTGKVTRGIRKSPCWAEVTYLRTPDFTSERQFLLLYIFALIEKQYGFAIEIADLAFQAFPNGIFEDCRKAAIKKVRSDRWKIPFGIFKRQIKKRLPGIDD